MRRDTIFRIASLSKPIAAAATTILVDEDRLQLDDSVEHWLPELANRKVLRRIDAQLDDTVPAQRQPIGDGHLGGDGPPHPYLTPGTDEWMRRLGELPLMYQPGERWLYNTSCDVLGVLVARASGKSFEAFLREGLFDPLGMKDTAFSVPASKINRLPGLYQFDHESKSFEVFDGVVNMLARPHLNRVLAVWCPRIGAEY